MAIYRFASFVVAASLLAELSAPGSAFASATYNCTGASNCSGNGGNGDNGTNNGNNSSDNVINVNIPGGGYSTSLAARQAYGSAGVVSLPSFAPLGCGSRSTAYAGLTGAPAGGYGANMAFGVGFMTAVGREPDICRPQSYMAAPSYQSSQQLAPQRQFADAYVSGRELQAAAEASSAARPSAIAYAQREALPQDVVTGTANASQMTTTRQTASGPAQQVSYVVYNRAGQPQYLTVAEPLTVPAPSVGFAAPGNGNAPMIAYIAPPGTNTASAVLQSPEAAAPQLTAVPAWTALRGNTSAAGAANGSRAMCVHLDDDVAHFYEQDLRNARSVADSARIVRDITTLDQACYHAYVRQAFGK